MPERLSPPITVATQGVNTVVHFDNGRYEDFLAQCGIRTGELADRKIIITTSSKNILAIGDYRPYSKELRMYVEPLESAREQYLDRAEEIIESGEPEGEDFQRFHIFDGMEYVGSTKSDRMYSGKRLARYLVVAPQGRARQTAERLVDTAINRTANEYLRHETKHMIDDVQGQLLNRKETIKHLLGFTVPEAVTLAAFGVICNYSGQFDPVLLAAMAGTGGLAGVLVSRFTNGAERRARKFAKETRNFPNIIKISPIGSRRGRI
jgi:hypothetical protein